MKKVWHIVKKWPQKFIIIGLVIILITGFAFFPKGANQPLEFYTVKRATIKSTVSASGTLSGKSMIDLKFNSAGEIYSLNVKAGDKIQPGQLLASLDNRDQLYALAQVQNNLRDKQATVDKIIDDIHLFQYGMGGFANVGSSSETMTQRQQRTQAEVARDNAFVSVKSAQKDLEDTLIVSPVLGVTTQVNASLNQQANTQNIIIRISDTSQVLFDAEIDEADINKVSLGQAAEVTLDAYPDQVLIGQVWEIQPLTKVSLSGAKVITVRIKLEEMREKFIQGLSGQASIILAEAKDSLVVPVEAIRENDTVLVKRNGQLVPQKIIQGVMSETEVEIKEGLNEGDQVVAK